MHSAVTAVAWEFWAANRRGWLVLLTAIPICAVLYRSLAEWLAAYDSLRTISFLPFVASLILAAAFCNFTDHNRRSGVAGFPQHLFVRPVNNRLLVTSLMICAVLSIVGLYVAWAKLVYQPAGIQLLVRWPVTLLAAGVVFYQAIIWCMSGLRLTRIVVMSFVATLLVGVGFLPFMPASFDLPSEFSLTISMCFLSIVAYGATIFSIRLQRRGGWGGLVWERALADKIIDAIPRRQIALTSPDRALFWYEWRRSGLVLPVAVLLATLLVMGPILSLTGRGDDATLRAVIWLSIWPILLAGPVGKGLAKPDFWSLELSMSPFLSARPITAGEIIAAKMKSAACSTLLAWTVLLTVAVPWVAWTCDMQHLQDLWAALRTVYPPVQLWSILVLLVVAAALITWNLIVSALWVGYSGRPGLYYTYVGASLVLLFAFAVCFAMWLDTPRHRGEWFLAVQPLIPWTLATCVMLKCWLSLATLARIRRRHLISDRAFICYLVFWLLATGSLVLLASLMSPHIEWLRNTLILAALLAIPTARVAAAPLALAWNRHRRS